MEHRQAAPPASRFYSSLESLAGHSPTSLCAQLEYVDNETHLSLADGGVHGDSSEPTSWQALSISHQ